VVSVRKNYIAVIAVRSCQLSENQALKFGKDCATLFMFLSSDRSYLLGYEVTDVVVAFLEATA
jgi:hypothetical protein